MSYRRQEDLEDLQPLSPSGVSEAAVATGSGQVGAALAQKPAENRTVRILLGILVSLFVVTLIALGIIAVWIGAGGEQKNEICRRPPVFQNAYDAALPVVSTNSIILIKNARILDEDIWDLTVSQNVLHHVLLVKGKIHQVVSDESKLDQNLLKQVTETYDAQGKFLTAGIVDMHSHLGVYAFPMDLGARNDGNEMSGPVTPFVRVVDALNPEDPAIQQMREIGGVTTSLVLPGSGNLIGGQAATVKMRATAKSVEELLVKGAPVAIKMACGENPKKAYGSHNDMPFSRLGAGYLFRRTFDEARTLLQQQREWDCNPENKDKPLELRPRNLELEVIAGLLQGVNVSLHNHCYEVEDLEMMLRLSQEFGFKITAFHHASEAWKLAHKLSGKNITIALFADQWAYKEEAYEMSVHAHEILSAAGVPVATKSDHPITHSKNLLHNAARSHFHGLSALLAIKSVTSIPANALQLGYRVGRVLPGFEGDLAVWDRWPLALAAQPVRVYIDGDVHFKRDTAPAKTVVEERPATAPQLVISGPGAQQQCNQPQRSDLYAIDGINQIVTLDDADRTIQNGRIVVRNGIVECIGSATDCPIPDGATVYKLQPGDKSFVVPGFIEASTNLGLQEIGAEPVTYDGSVDAVVHFNAAQYAVRLQSKTMAAAWKGGILASVSHPMGTSLVNGFSTSFHTAGNFITDSLIQGKVALHVNIGTSVKSSGVQSSVSGQLTELRRRLTAAKNNDPSADAAFVSLLKKEIVMAAQSNNADDINQLLELQREFDFNLVIIGGAEAHLVKEKLAAQKVGVILYPMSEEWASMQKWDTTRSSNDHNVDELFAAGVKVGIGSGVLYDSRNLRWFAGIMSKDGRGVMEFKDALRTVTRNIAEMFQIQSTGIGSIQVGKPASFLLLDGHPLTFLGKPRLLASRNILECNPEQF